MAVVPVELFDAGERSGDTLDRVTGEIEVERMLQRRITLMRREDLNVTPRKADQVRFELRGGIADSLAALRDGKQREIEDPLTYLRFPSVDKVRQVGDPNGIDFFARKENVED
jgi:hypothetical protein